MCVAVLKISSNHCNSGRESVRERELTYRELTDFLFPCFGESSPRSKLIKVRDLISEKSISNNRSMGNVESGGV